LSCGPGNWCVLDDLWYLSSDFHLPVSFKHIRLCAWAAKLRVGYDESNDPDDPWDPTVKSTQLLEHRLHSEYSDRRKLWQEWYDSAFCSRIAAAKQSATELGISVSSMSARPTHKTNTRSQIQRFFYQSLLLHRAHRPNFEERLRHKLKRWKVKPLGTLSRRLPNIYAKLASLVPPKVICANIKTLFNGWCTDARFRNMHGRAQTGPCVFGCSATAEDRIEHYACCPRVVDFAQRFFRVHSPECSLPAFLLCVKGMSSEQLTTQATLVYAVFRAMHSLRGGAGKPATYVYDMLEQYAKAALKDPLTDRDL